MTSGMMWGFQAVAAPGSTKGIVEDIPNTRIILEMPDILDMNGKQVDVYREYFLYPAQMATYQNKKNPAANVVLRINYGSRAENHRFSYVVLGEGCKKFSGLLQRIDTKTLEPMGEAGKWYYNAQKPKNGMQYSNPNNDIIASAIATEICKDLDRDYANRYEIERDKMLKSYEVKLKKMSAEDEAEYEETNRIMEEAEKRQEKEAKQKR